MKTTTAHIKPNHHFQVSQVVKVTLNLQFEVQELTLSKNETQYIYEITDQCIGEGSYGKVFKAINQSTKTPCVVKISEKSNTVAVDQMLAEYQLLALCNHKNIVKILDYCETKTQMFLFTELCPGETLFSILEQNAKLPEKMARQISKQLLEAVMFLQTLNIVHRDIKLENVLASVDAKGKVQIKLIDFGCAYQYKKGETLNAFCGSLFYMAPEIFHQSYNEKCDLWSIGVLSYALVTGRFPFDSEDEEKIPYKIMQKKHQYKNDEKDYISRPFRKLIKNLLVKDVNQRINVDQAYYGILMKKSKNTSH